MREEIKEICRQLEQEKGIKIIFAVESGSRAWRLNSKDSDYDVRFVFVRPMEEYLKINERDEVIISCYDEQGNKHPQEGCFIDMEGFDIFKFSRMLSSSNPTVIEWLQSDILYYGNKPQCWLDRLDNKINFLSLYFHYKSMCKANYVKYLKSGNDVTYKKYLYAMRGLVNAKWIVEYKMLPKINFSDTISEINPLEEAKIDTNQFRHAIKEVVPVFILKRLGDIIFLKTCGREKDIVENDTYIDMCIENFLKDDSDAPESNRILETYTDLNEEILKQILQSRSK